MPADPIIYCLTEVTDYRGFERFCCDLMVKCGWRGLEPLGGVNDGGRDALFTTKASGPNVIFAFSARADWYQKLREDLRRIRDVGHRCDQVVFVSNRAISASERDEAVELARTEFKVALDLYSVERVRIELNDRAQTLIRIHSNIFTPTFFQADVGFLEVERPAETAGNCELAALELAFSSRNMVSRFELVADLAGRTMHRDLHVPLEALVSRLSAAGRVLLRRETADRLAVALNLFRDAVFAADPNAMREAVRCQAELAASKQLLGDERIRAAFAVGELLGEWDRCASETRDVSAAALAGHLELLGVVDLLPRIEGMIERFRGKQSVMDVHVPSEIADLLRHRFGSPASTQPSLKTVPGDWQEVETGLQELRGRFRKDGRQKWTQLQARKQVAPDSVVRIAEKLVVTAEDEEAYAMVDLLRREPPPNVAEVWRRLSGPLIRGEFGPDTRLSVAYQCVSDEEGTRTLFNEMLQRDLPPELASDLLSAVYSCVDRGGPVLRANVGLVDEICRKYEGHVFVRKIRERLG